MTTHAHANDAAAHASCPTCQANEDTRRKMDDEADKKARQKFRLFVILYLVYPAIIFGLLGIIGFGAYKYYTGWSTPPEPTQTAEPSWCYPGSMAGYSPAPRATTGDGYESAIPKGGSPLVPSITPQIGIPSIASGVQAGGASARERIAYYVYVSIRAADGSQDARYERNMIGLSHVELGVARQKFADRSRQDGRLGFIRLGIAQLGADVYDIAQSEKMTVPFCRPNDFANVDKRQAYVNFAIASYCDTAGATRANDWLNAVADHENFDAEQIAAMQNEAANYLAAEPQACAVQLADQPPPQPGAGDYDDSEPVDAPPPPSAAAIRGTQGGAPPSDDEISAAHARQLLNLGDAALAEGRLNRARRWWLKSIEAGKRVGAQASITAQKRIQTHTLTCHFTGESVKAISRDYKERSGDLIHLRVIQEALHALGHYDGPVNGVLSVQTRAAIRKFQREMAFDETDTLTPLQTVYVICNAAETARDLSSTNALGIMYVTGLGVERNVDLALEWLRSASTRRYPDATFNLALIYGTGIVLNSYRLCDIPQDIEQADQYLREAAHQNHPVAAEMWRRHAGKSPADRWKAIEADLTKYDERGVFKKTKEELPPLGKDCKPADGGYGAASPT